MFSVLFELFNEALLATVFEIGVVFEAASFGDAVGGDLAAGGVLVCVEPTPLTNGLLPTILADVGLTSCFLSGFSLMSDERVRATTGDSTGVLVSRTGERTATGVSGGLACPDVGSALLVAVRSRGGTAARAPALLRRLSITSDENPFSSCDADGPVDAVSELDGDEAMGRGDVASFPLVKLFGCDMPLLQDVAVVPKPELSTGADGPSSSTVAWTGLD